jgi:ribonuclease Z
MLLGHFSSKYEDISEFLVQAKQTFENTDVSKEGVTYII